MKLLEEKSFLFTTSAVYLQVLPLVSILLQGLLGMLEYGSSQAEVRNTIFMVLFVGPKKIIISYFDKSNDGKVLDVFRRLTRIAGQIATQPS